MTVLSEGCPVGPLMPGSAARGAACAICNSDIGRVAAACGASVASKRIGGALSASGKGIDARPNLQNQTPRIKNLSGDVLHILTKNNVYTILYYLSKTARKP